MLKDDCFCLVSEVYREEGHSQLNDIKLNSQRFGNISKEICRVISKRIHD